MTKKDLELIAAAKNTFAWENINPEDADTDDARKILEELRSDAYHMEEAIYGLI